jgi:hypothetical protein
MHKAAVCGNCAPSNEWIVKGMYHAKWDCYIVAASAEMQLLEGEATWKCIDYKVTK